MRISLFFVCGYLILFTQLAPKKLYVTRQIKKIWVSVWNEVLVNCESLDPNSTKIEGFHKGDNFINDIAFGASLFVYIFPILICVNFLSGPFFFFKCLKMAK